MGILKSILKSGVSHVADPLGMRRIIFFNYLIVFCIVGAIFLTVVTSSFEYVTQSLVCFSAALLFAISLILNKKGFFLISEYVFLITSLCLVSIGTLINIESGLYVDSENMLLPLMAITMFVFDGKRKHFVYWTVFGIYILFKHYALTSVAHTDSIQYALGIINNVIVGAVLYAFLLAFRSILIKALDRSEEDEKRLFSMIDNVPVFLALVDPMGNYILANKNYADNFQIEKRAIIGKNRKDILPKKLFKSQKEYFEKAQSGHSAIFLQETLLPNGTIISANGKYEPIVDRNGNVEAITICVDDVTPLIKAQEALTIANETKDKLFSIIAHDIKSPLNMFETFLNMSKEAKMTEDEFFEYQNILGEKLGSVTTTVNELLDWSRMQLGGINAYPETVNVCDVVNENIGLFDSLIKKKNIEFKVETSCDVLAWIDENHFKVAIRNLIHNAIKFTNGGGTVEVNSNQTKDGTIVRIVDTGVGMNSATIDSIIKKEIQDSQAGTEKEMGTGLGISLTIGLLEKNNCEIAVESELNKGTTFEIRIPNKQKEPASI